MPLPPTGGAGVLTRCRPQPPARTRGGEAEGRRRQLPALPATVSGDPGTGVLRGAERVQPWVARSPRGTGWSRVLAAADETGGEIWAR